MNIFMEGYRFNRMSYYIFPFNVFLVVFFNVMNILDYITTIILTSQGHIELNSSIAIYLESGMLVQLFFRKVILVGVISFLVLYVEHYFEEKYYNSILARVSPLVYTCILVVINMLMTMVVISNMLIIQGVGGFFDGGL